MKKEAASQSNWGQITSSITEELSSPVKRFLESQATTEDNQFLDGGGAQG